MEMRRGVHAIPPLGRDLDKSAGYSNTLKIYGKEEGKEVCNEPTPVDGRCDSTADGVRVGGKLEW